MSPWGSQPPTHGRQSLLAQALLVPQVENAAPVDKRPVHLQAFTEPTRDVPSTPYGSPSKSPPRTQHQRPRPASYHGHTASVSNLLNGVQTSPTQSGMKMSGGIKPLHLPHIVAVSPRLSADKPLTQPPSPAFPSPEFGERSNPDAETSNRGVESQWGSLGKRRQYDGRPRSLDSKAVLSMHVRSRSVSPRQRAILLPDVEPLPDNTIVTSPPDLNSFPIHTTSAPSKHRRTESLKAFANQERESLLFRISELETALQEAKDPDQASLKHEETNPDSLDNSGLPLAHLIEDLDNSIEKYPSPPHSPMNHFLSASSPSTALTKASVEMHNEDTHIISSLLDHMPTLFPSTSNSHPTGLRVLLTSPTMNLGAGADDAVDSDIRNHADQQQQPSLTNSFASPMGPLDDETSSPILGTE